MSKKLVVGNWKMNPLSQKDAEKLFKDVLKGLSNLKRTEVVVAPPAVFIKQLKKISKKVMLGHRMHLVKISVLLPAKFQQKCYMTLV